MSKLLTPLLLAALLVSSVASANSSGSIVRCWADVKGTTQTIRLKIAANGKIKQWDETRIADTDTQNVFGALGESLEEYGFEYTRTFKAPNGFSIVIAGTTADEFSVGVSEDRSRGFFKYRDLGSGNGNSEMPLKCSAE